MNATAPRPASLPDPAPARIRRNRTVFAAAAAAAALAAVPVGLMLGDDRQVQPWMYAAVLAVMVLALAHIVVTGVPRLADAVGLPATPARDERERAALNGAWYGVGLYYSAAMLVAFMVTLNYWFMVILAGGTAVNYLTLWWQARKTL